MANPNTAAAIDTHAIPSPLAAPAARRGAILVVEDRYDVRQGMSQLLELHGFLVVDAAGAEAALEHLGADPRGFALILLDLMMPGPLTGVEFRSRQLGTATLADIPTIVVSATEMVPPLVEQLRPDAWITKPFRFDDLLAVVKQFVTPRRAQWSAIDRHNRGGSASRNPPYTAPNRPDVPAY